MSCSTLHSPPPSPHPVPLPISSSSVTSCPELDLSVTLSPTPMIDDTQQKLRTLKQSVLNEQSQMNRCQSGPAGNKRSTKEMSEDPVTITGTAEPQKLLPLQPVLRPHRHLVEPSSALSNQHPSCLERAGLNTTLALKANLQSLQDAEFNSQKVLQETLQKSARTKSLINTRATEVVNVSRSQLLFTSLVSVDVQEDQLISQVLQDRLLLAPPPCCKDTKTTEGPSLLFMTSDLIHQKPLPLNEEPVCKRLPVPCPAYSTFDLYSRQKCWEATL
ncbi:protein phosphatase 1 regulatory subunit 35 [Nothobranchius furzeri]|uniref:Protein phosphatase 1 regulatory subunit 35 n=2 Tax=Nothobranchius furzeri TaxID=105023 RepID=A0A1A8AY62_NOTFU|nr:protein phosphatase 1 regulatory subunit 35 [Nothobranchius furzeri]XP_054597908.1 protein phosphatase 1 regulatory subunit 35 [Nothobranchius furzeri]KAF7201067.1 protein phosphatase 1 regulatory subunit 35-like [Nothobranchius furzeri]